MELPPDDVVVGIGVGVELPSGAVGVATGVGDRRFAEAIGTVIVLPQIDPGFFTQNEAVVPVPW